MKMNLKKAPRIYKLLINTRSFFRSIRGHYILSKSVKNTSPIRIVIGSSGYFDDGWIPTDIEFLDILNETHWEKYFQTNQIDALLAEHVWEHLTLEQGSIAARFCYRYLKPGSYLRVAVPDGYHPNKNYIDQVKVGGMGEGADDHKILFNHVTLSNLFENVGFDVELLEYFDSDGNFHFTDWDPNDGKILRSRRFDYRNKNGSLNFSSIIIDAKKEFIILCSN